ncbi:tetranectin-like [Lingula anatina]|uniref:Tetranectin-like n=1 Tax=Lingula anatina TaxID=7574 RepID=A0A1S3ISC8_LINAN|nr:tetranectin-like [Lingula anatina]|eukprot:XP_013400978.1 tetranectin-like [Lingula anatina]
MFRFCFINISTIPDVNECTDPGVCPGQHCVNLEGSFRCQDCPIGYSSPGCKDRDCPPQFQKVGTKCIYISSAKANFQDANAKCRDLGKGFGHLTIIEDKLLYKRLTNQMALELNYWIGIRSEADGSLKYVDGRPMQTNAYNEWETSPKANPSMQCAMMSGPKDFVWIMRNCDESLPFACEAPMKNNQPLIG